MDLEEAKKRRNALRREQYALDGGKRKEANREWKEAHREQVREAGKEYQRIRRQTEPEKVNAVLREWRKNNPEKQKANYARWYAKKGNAYHKQYGYEDRRNNPGRYILRNCKNRAKRVGLEFNLEAADIIIPEFCPVLGHKLEIGNRGFSDCSPSVDRMDSKKGYVRGNINVISWRANLLKRDGTLEEMRKIVAYMEQAQ